MKIKKHEISVTGMGITDEILLAAFEEAWRLSKKLDSLYKSCEYFDNEEIDDDDLADLCAEISLNCPNLIKISVAHCSTIPRVDRYCIRMIKKIETLRDSIVEGQSTYFADGTGEIKELISQSMGFLAYWITQEFRMENTEEIDSIVNLYVNANAGVTFESLRDKAHGWMNMYNMPISIFDAIPELEESFYAVMGPDVAEIDEDYLTADDVVELLNNVITPAMLVSRVNKRVLEDNDGVAAATGF